MTPGDRGGLAMGLLIVAWQLAAMTEYLIGRWTGEIPPDEVDD